MGQRKARPHGVDAIEISEVYQYGDGLEEEVTREVIHLLREPQRDREDVYLHQLPQKTLTLVDEVVRYISDNHRRSHSYWGAQFQRERCYSSDVPFQGAKYEWVLRESNIASTFYAILRAFYYLLCMPEYGAAKYCVSIEAARSALLFAYPNGFVELPPINFPRQDDVPETEFRKAVTELVWPAAEQYNRAVQKIAEIVTQSDYRSKQARELSKLSLRASSVSALITGLLHHHGCLTVVAVRLSIRQSSALDFIGKRMQSALARLIGDRRADPHLKSALGFFWVLQESFKVNLRQRLSTIRNQSVAGGIAVHYDLVLFFDARRIFEAADIATHIDTRWGRVTNGQGTCCVLNRETITPYLSDDTLRAIGEVVRFPASEEFVGLVKEGTVQAVNLRRVARTMVYSTTLRKPDKKSLSPTLIADGARRYGKSDLLTGCGYGKEGRGTKKGKSDQKYERTKRLKY